MADKKPTKTITIEDLDANLEARKTAETTVVGKCKSADLHARELRSRLVEVAGRAADDRARAVLDNRKADADLAHAVELAETDVRQAEQHHRDCLVAAQNARAAVQAAEAEREAHRYEALKSSLAADIRHMVELRNAYGQSLSALRDKAIRHGYPGGLPQAAIFGVRDPNDLTAWVRYENQAYAMNATLRLYDLENPRGGVK
jgi:hypothetical protein